MAKVKRRGKKGTEKNSFTRLLWWCFNLRQLVEWSENRYYLFEIISDASWRLQKPFRRAQLFFDRWRAAGKLFFRHRRSSRFPLFYLSSFDSTFLARILTCATGRNLLDRIFLFSLLNLKSFTSAPLLSLLPMRELHLALFCSNKSWLSCGGSRIVSFAKKKK